MKSSDQSKGGAHGVSNDVSGKSGSVPRTDHAKSYREILEETGEADPAVYDKVFGKRNIKSS